MPVLHGLGLAPAKQSAMQERRDGSSVAGRRRRSTAVLFAYHGGPCDSRVVQARGVEWQDFGRSGAWLRCADLDRVMHAAPKPWAGMVHHSTGSPRLTPG